MVVGIYEYGMYNMCCLLGVALHCVTAEAPSKKVIYYVHEHTTAVCKKILLLVLKTIRTRTSIYIYSKYINQSIRSAPQFFCSTPTAANKQTDNTLRLYWRHGVTT